MWPPLNGHMDSRSCSFSGATHKERPCFAAERGQAHLQPRNRAGFCRVKFCHKISGLEHILGRSRGGPFSKMWPPLNGHMDSHSCSFSGATHKERPCFAAERGQAHLQPRNRAGFCPVKFCDKISGLEHILGRSRGGPFSKMWPPLNGHMDSHSCSFSGATHKERPCFAAERGQAHLQPRNRTGFCRVKFCHKISGLEHILGRSRGGPFSKMWPPLNGHMDSHSCSFSGATHKELGFRV